MSQLLSWAVIVATLAVVVLWEVSPSATVAPGPLPARQASGATPGATGSSPELSGAPWAATALERPLFQQSRRPVKAAGSATEADRTARLIGVVTGPFGARAIFAAAGDGKPIVVGEGAKVTDFVVRSISPGQALVEGETGLRMLRLSLGGLSADK